LRKSDLVFSEGGKKNALEKGKYHIGKRAVKGGGLNPFFPREGHGIYSGKILLSSKKKKRAGPKGVKKKKTSRATRPSWGKRKEAPIPLPKRRRLYRGRVSSNPKKNRCLSTSSKKSSADDNLEGTKVIRCLGREDHYWLEALTQKDVRKRKKNPLF